MATGKRRAGNYRMICGSPLAPRRATTCGKRGKASSRPGSYRQRQTSRGEPIVMFVASERYVAAIRTGAARCTRHPRYWLASCLECRECQRVKR